MDSLVTYRDGVRPIVVQLGQRMKRLGGETYTGDERPYVNAVQTLQHMGGLALVGLLHTHEGLAREVTEKFGLKNGRCDDLAVAHKAFIKHGIDVSYLDEPVAFINAFKHGPGRSMDAAYDRQGPTILNATTRAFVGMMDAAPITRGVALKRLNLDLSLARFDRYAVAFIDFWQAFPTTPRQA
jgi:hypothetical protein